MYIQHLVKTLTRLSLYPLFCYNYYHTCNFLERIILRKKTDNQNEIRLCQENLSIMRILQ